jgi:hypothetical protein
VKNTLNLNWNIKNNLEETEERYCPACGKKVVFKDSLIRRQNANGKNIYHFAIFKCEKDHTWNKQLGIFKTISGLENKREFLENKADNSEIINLDFFIQNGIELVIINIESIDCKIRLDKFISGKIEKYSRNYINSMINDGIIRINDFVTKPNKAIKEGDNISLDLGMLVDKLAHMEQEGEDKNEDRI